MLSGLSDLVFRVPKTRLEDADKRQIAIFPLVVQTITNYELIGNFKAYIVKRNIY